jgi:hypothetical protein
MGIVVLIGNIQSANFAIKTGAFLAPAKKTETAVGLCLLYIFITTIGVILFWDAGLGSSERPGIIYFIGGKGGLWRWWLLFCALMSVIAAMWAALTIYEEQKKTENLPTIGLEQ